jgi:hypothetical protein
MNFFRFFVTFLYRKPPPSSSSSAASYHHHQQQNNNNNDNKIQSKIVTNKRGAVDSVLNLWRSDLKISSSLSSCHWGRATL